MGPLFIIFLFIVYAAFYGRESLEKENYIGLILGILAALAGVFVIVVRLVFYAL